MTDRCGTCLNCIEVAELEDELPCTRDEPAIVAPKPHPLATSVSAIYDADFLLAGQAMLRYDQLLEVGRD